MQPQSRAVPRAVATGVVALAVLLMGGSGAGAHSQLTGSEPAAGSTVESPTEVVLAFNEELLQVGTQLTLTDAEGVEHVLEPRYPEPHLAAADLPAVPAGATSLVWRVVSADGHPIEGVLEFVVTVPEPVATSSAGPSPSPPPTAPQDETPSPSPTVLPSNVPMPEQSGGVPVWLWLALAAAVAAATGIAVWSARNR